MPVLMVLGGQAGQVQQQDDDPINRNEPGPQSSLHFPDGFPPRPQAAVKSRAVMFPGPYQLPPS